VSSLKDALGVPRANYNPVRAAYDGMNDEDKAVLKGALWSTDYTHAQIAEALRKVGYDVDRKQVQAFREKMLLGKVEL
jgi:hypothetical protein